MINKVWYHNQFEDGTPFAFKKIDDDVYELMSIVSPRENERFYYVASVFVDLREISLNDEVLSKANRVINKCSLIEFFKTYNGNKTLKEVCIQTIAMAKFLELTKNLGIPELSTYEFLDGNWDDPEYIELYIDVYGYSENRAEAIKLLKSY